MPFKRHELSKLVGQPLAQLRENLEGKELIITDEYSMLGV